MGEIPDIVDLRRYPIGQPGSEAAAAAIAACRAQMVACGLCLLPGFVRHEALRTMLAQARALLPQAHHTEHWRATSIARETRASIGAVAYDRIGGDSPLRALYDWPGFTAFIAGVLDVEALYPSADPLVGCMLTVFGPGDELGWHYDPNDGVVSLVLQAPRAGGEFEFAPGVRGDSRAEASVLDGRYPGTVSRGLRPGTLSLFNGHRSLHRVAPVRGARERIVALFNYAAEPGYRFSADIHRKFFGRAA